MKCWRCNGKGGYEQLTGFSEDDIAWDLCPECNGSGKIDEKRKQELEKLYKAEEELFRREKEFNEEI